MDKPYYLKNGLIVSIPNLSKQLNHRGAKKLGIEIRTFTSLKDLTEYIANQSIQLKALFEDYSQWLGSVLRDAESSHKNEEWYQKSAALQKTLKAQSKKPVETDKTKKSGKGKEETSCWIQSGSISISFTEQGQTEILFVAIEKINTKVQELEKFKGTVQQLARLGLGQTVNYIVYIEEDVPKKIVLKQKAAAKGDETFKFMAELSIPAYYNSATL